jgi:hypothetical protein
MKTTDDPANTGENLDDGRFKKGFDKRRWLQGRPKIPKDRAEAQKIIDNVIWEELSRTITNPDSKDEVDALRLMIRSMIRNKNMQDKILDRILGKVAQGVELTGKDGGALVQPETMKPSEIAERVAALLKQKE